MTNVEIVYALINDFRWTHHPLDYENTDMKLAKAITDGLSEMFAKAHLYERQNERN